jgi:hypothetical protein
MIPPMFTRQQWLMELLRRFTRRGYAPNLTLLLGGCTADVCSESDEVALALVRAADDSEYIITNHRVILRGETLIHYDELVRCHWVTDDPDPVKHSRLKVEFFDRLILEGENGKRVVLTQLDQAAFALLKFFDFVARERAGNNKMKD